MADNITKRGRGRRRALKVLAGLGLTGLGGWVALSPRRTNAYYQGPASDHFDGMRFYNPVAGGGKSLAQLLRWRFEPTEAWPSSFPSPFSDKPPSSVAGEAVRVAHVGHATFLIQTRGRNILIDPVWSDRASPVSFAGPRRINAPGIAFEDLPVIHAVLVTHNHYDHMDVATVARLHARHRPKVVTPLGNDTILRDAVKGLDTRAVDWGDVVDLGDGINIHAVPTHHWSARRTTDRMHALWASFVVASDAKTLYCIGDTGFGDGRTFEDVAARHPRIDAALIPIGAYEPRWFMRDQHVNPEEAVKAFKLSGAARAIGHHWGTFQLTNEGIERPVEHLTAALAAERIDAKRFTPARPGQVFEI
jgi:L-ascorbate metabolism protein UlaG (beta-lactamase superfamily)